MRSGASKRRSRGTRGSGRLRTVDRARPVLARELDDVGKAARGDERRAGPLALEQRVVATVMPCAKAVSSPASRPAAASAARTAAMTPSDWSAGVVGAFAVTIRPSTARTASVNVPPTSTPKQHAPTATAPDLFVPGGLDRDHAHRPETPTTNPTVYVHGRSHTAVVRGYHLPATALYPDSHRPSIESRDRERADAEQGCPGS